MSESSELFDLIITNQQYTRIKSQLKELEIENNYLKNDNLRLRNQIQKNSPNLKKQKGLESAVKHLSFKAIQISKLMMEEKEKIESSQQNLQRLVQNNKASLQRIKYFEQINKKVQQLLREKTELLQIKQKEATSLQANITNSQTYINESNNLIKSQQERFQSLKTEFELLLRTHLEQKLKRQWKQKQMEVFEYRLLEANKQITEFNLKVYQLEQQKQIITKQSQQAFVMLQQFLDEEENIEQSLIIKFNKILNNFKHKLIDAGEEGELANHLFNKKKSLFRALEKQYQQSVLKDQ